MLQQLLSQQAPVSLALSNLYQADLQELSSQSWYSMDPNKAFNSNWSYGGSGGCQKTRHTNYQNPWKAPEFMKYPYI